MGRKQNALLPELEPPSHKDIDDAAATYVEARDKRMKLTEKEVECHDSLLELMHKHKLTSYEFDGYLISVNPVEKVKVKKVKGENGDQEEDEKDE